MRRVLGPSLRRLQANWLSAGLHLSSRSLDNTRMSAVVFSPHQDDETLGCGGTIALKRAQDTPVEVVFLTDGRQSPSPLEPQALVEVRKREAQDALAILGVPPAQVHFLDKPDAGLRSLPAPERKALVEHIAVLLEACKPEEVYVPHRNDRHYYGDHEATYELVSEAIERTGLQLTLLQYPVWILWQAPLLFDLKIDELVGAHRLSIAAVLEKKRAATRVYQSQIFPDGFLERFCVPYEIFFK